MQLIDAVKQTDTILSPGYTVSDCLVELYLFADFVVYRKLHYLTLAECTRDTSRHTRHNVKESPSDATGYLYGPLDT